MEIENKKLEQIKEELKTDELSPMEISMILEKNPSDEVAEQIGDGEYGPFPLQRFEPGDIWYEKMCSRTLGDARWGMYDQGVVSSSGFGEIGRAHV